MRHAVIMAGGAGTRLWPLSRRRRPKQLMRIFEGKSLLRLSFDRLKAVVGAENVYIITGGAYIPAMREELPEMPAGNFMAEPCARDTANAVGLAAHLLAQRDPEGTMGIFTADHIITPVDVFAKTVTRGFEAAETHADALITFGIKPTEPHTGYGYVHRGTALEEDVYEIRQFREKPDLETAKAYYASGEYYWNSGMFVWRIPTILEQFRRHQPEIAAGLAEVTRDFQNESRAEQVRAGFEALPKISVDFAIMEKADRVACVEMPCTWLDVGSWTSLADVFETDDGGNTRAAPNVLTMDAGGNIVVSEDDHLVALVGCQDLIVIHSDDATVVCRRDDAQKIKALVERVKEVHGQRYT